MNGKIDEVDGYLEVATEEEGNSVDVAEVWFSVEKRVLVFAAQEKKLGF